MNGGTKEVPVQVNGKLRFCITVDADDTSENILKKIKSDFRVSEILEKNEIVKEIYVPNKIFNIVIKNN